jgi:hypothetical protein
MKATLRRLGARTYDALVEGMRAALEGIAVSDIMGWFRHCGYC